MGAENLRIGCGYGGMQLLSSMYLLPEKPKPSAKAEVDRFNSYRKSKKKRKK